MKILDLTLPLYDKMPVFEGDPEVQIEQIHFLNKEGWNLRKLVLTTHLGTHVNLPIHMTPNGKTLSDYELNDFIGTATLFETIDDIKSDHGIIFSSQNIDLNIANKLVELRPKFIGLSSKFEFELDLEKLLLEAGIISFENIVNTDLLPKNFTFYGIPLNINEADGSPVRAFAIVN